MNDSPNRKRKQRHKNKNWKRTKLPSTRIFQEASFDSSDDNDHVGKIAPDKSESLVSQFKQVLNLTPSKSECDTTDVISDSESSELLAGSLTENSFEISSDDEVSYSYSSIAEEFLSESCDERYTEVVSAEICCASEAQTPVVVQRKKKPPAVPKKTKSEKTHLFSQDVHCCFTNEGIVVILEKNDTVYFHGLCLLTVLQGQVEVLGHTLTKNSPEAKLYSPRGSSLLYLRNVTESDVPTQNLLSLQSSVKLTEKCAIVLCKKLPDPEMLFIEKHISQLILPKENAHFPRVVFEPKEGNWNLLKVGENWNNIIQGVDKNTKLMICGGKGVGKTTFLRFAINQLLMRFSEVRVIDLDPGQSEFTVPGCISIVRVGQPVFGVNFTHLQQAERSILSNINIAYEPDKYIASVKHLLNFGLDQIPTLINYMGYTHGIGINILSAVITCVQPSDVLQICSTDSKRNYKSLLKTDVVRENATLFVPVCQLSYNLLQVESMCDYNDSWTCEPRQLREMCVLSYVSRLIDCDSIFKSKSPMYRIDLGDVFITDTKGESIHPAAVNACLVALCTLENEEEQIFQCFSWGIVRGIDLVSNELVLITSEKLEVLDKVTHLVASGATLPPSIYMTPDEVTGSLPYVIEGVLMSFGQIPKRSRLSAKSAN